MAVVVLVAAPAARAALRVDGPTTSSAEIRIDFPQGAEPHVTVSPGVRRISLELPRGSVFPLDFAASSGGLLRGGEVTSIDDDRVRLDLELAQGLLESVDYTSTGVVVRFSSRFAAPGSAPEPDGYQLGPEDRLSVTVHGHPDLSTEVTIGADGTVTLPLVSTVAAAGTSPRRLADTVADLLGRDYLVDPQVDVAVLEYRSKWVMVSGEVRVPGRTPLRGGTRLKEVLSEAGGFTDNAGPEIILTRQTDDGAGQERRVIDRLAFEAGQIDPVLQHGDIVDVPTARYCFVQGEVRAPGKVRVERGLTLTKAIALSGGMTDWAKSKEVRVILEGLDGKVTVYNVRRILAGKDDDPLLRGGESVVVPRRYF